MLLGIHASTAGGIRMAPEHGARLGCTAIQIFTKNQRQWGAPPLTEEEVAAYFENLKKTKISSVVSHDSYLINMASPDPAMRSKSTAAFTDEMKRAQLLKLDGIVFHPGSHMGAGEGRGIAFLADSIRQAVEKSPGNRVPLLIEATAGQGNGLGYKFEHLRDMLSALAGVDSMGVCLDTCHIFGAGYDIRKKEAFEETLRAFDRIVGLKYLKCIHLNDSMNPLGSRKDRHDNIGRGEIGKEAFRLFLADRRLEHVPKILETPGGDEWYRKDLKVLRNLMKRKK